MDAEQIRQLEPKLDRFLERFADCFTRKDTRAHLGVYVRGQLSSLPEKSVEPSTGRPVAVSATPAQASITSRPPARAATWIPISPRSRAVDSAAFTSSLIGGILTNERSRQCLSGRAHYPLRRRGVISL